MTHSREYRVTMVEEFVIGGSLELPTWLMDGFSATFF